MSQNRGPQGQQQLQRRPASGTVTRMAPAESGLTRLADNQPTTQLTTFDAAEAAHWIEQAAERSGGKIVTPSMMPVFPHGRGVAVSIIHVTDLNPQGTQVYPIPGSSNLGLHKNVLDDIGRAYGIDWPREWTREVSFTLPNAKETDPRDLDPWCLKIEVCGRYKKFDGTWSTLPALTKEIDLREWDPVAQQVPAEVDQIRTRHLEKQTKDLPRDATQAAIDERQRIAKRGADAELAQLRKFIRAHAQTKARLMVIGTLVRRSYSPQELQTPFYVFSSVWTGRSANPEIDMMLAKGALDMEKEGRALLYGGTGVAEPAQLPAVSSEPYQADAEVAEYEKAMAAAEGGEPSSGTETATTQSTQVKQCTPTQCFGADPAALHVNACYGPVGAQVSSEESTSQPAPQPWLIPRGAHKDKNIRDETLITPEILSRLRDFYLVSLEDAELPDLKRAELKAEADYVEDEIKRRQLFEYAPKN